MNKHIWVIAALSASLAAEESATINRARVNVRGGPSFASEVITQLQKGDTVTFLEEVAVEKPKAGEPSKWAAIKLPANTAVWVYMDFLNEKTVKVPRLNLRAGPGENFSVVGRLQRGDTVKELRTVEGWMQIEAPETTRAFVDSSYLTRTNTPPPEPIKVFEPKTEPAPVAKTPEPAPVVVAAKPEETKSAETKPVEQPKATEQPKPAETKPPEPTTAVATPTPVVTPPAETKPVVTIPAETKPAEKAPEPEPRVLPKVADPLPARTETVTVKRIVRREGEVKATILNIQAPTYFQLVAHGKAINYLNGEKNQIKLKDYKGLRVIVTGEEFIEPRFPERPMLEIETIEVAP